MNKLYTQRFTDWLSGIPVYFYFVFTAVKIPLLTLLGFVVGLPLLFRRKLGDGRYFILFWFMLWVGVRVSWRKVHALLHHCATGSADHERAGNSVRRTLVSKFSLDQRLETLRARGARCDCYCCISY